MDEKQASPMPDASTVEKVKDLIWSNEDLDILEYLVAKKAKKHLLGWIGTAVAVVAFAGLLGWNNLNSLQQELDKKASSLDKKEEQLEQRAIKSSERFDVLTDKQEKILLAFRDSQDRVLSALRDDEKEVRHSTDASRQEIFGASQSLVASQRDLMTSVDTAKRDAEQTSRVRAEVEETQKKTQEQVANTLRRVAELERFFEDTYRISTPRTSDREAPVNAEPGISRARRRPALGGDSVSYGPGGDARLSAQTLSCLVRDAAGTIYVLTVGPVRPGSVLYQPGLLDGGQEGSDEIGREERAIPLSSGGLDLAASLARVSNPSLVSPEIRSIGKLKGIAVARLAQVVSKFGRTTGMTRGKVTSIDTDLNLNYTGRAFLFKGLILVEGDNGPMADPGDVGAVLVDSNHNAVGLLIAASTRFAAFMPIQKVLDSLEVTLVTSE